MAALKPGFFSVPLISGGEIELSDIQNDRNIEFLLKGIFQKIWEDFIGEAPNIDEKVKKIDRSREWGMMPVVILDELNSLDIDAQGALLRLLQNMKIQVLGSVDEYPNDVNMNFLIIGIVNEPEDALTLEDTLKKLYTEKDLIGTLASRMLYEKFRKMRRLREDLYHRLVRDGKIDLKGLRERREDIPILFSFFVKEELPPDVKWIDLWIDINTYEELMDSRINWDGNFRQLQSIAKKVVVEAKKEKNNQEFLKNKMEIDFFRITKNHLTNVLKKEYRIEDKYQPPDFE